jgi:hypothetical protein
LQLQGLSVVPSYNPRMQQPLSQFPIEPWLIFALVAVQLAMMLLLFAAWWRIFEKAGEPGWAAIVPIYNAILILKIAGKPLWWIVLMLIPFVGIVVGLIVLFALAKRFGKGAGFALGMIVLAPIFYPLLAWGDARYEPAQ